MKRFKFMPKLAAVIISAAMIFSGAVPAFADGTANPNGGNLTLSSQTVSFNTKLVLDVTKSSNGIATRVPTKTISYNIENGTADDTKGILAGVNADSLSVTNSSFSNDTSSIKNNEDKPYVIATSSIDFSKANFTSSGIYRYNITAGANYDPAFSGDFGMVQYIDVVVVNEGNGYVVKDAAMINNGKTSKTDKFQFKYQATYLKFTKDITGNQADVTKRFDFTMELSNLSQPVTVAYSDVTTSSEGDYLQAILKPTNGKVTESFKLTRSSSVVVDNIPLGYSFDISEDPSGYTPSVSSDDISGSSLSSDHHLTERTITKKIEFTVTNNSDGSVPTGVIFAVAPFAIGAVAIVLFVILKVRKAAKQ